MLAVIVDIVGLAVFVVVVTLAVVVVRVLTDKRKKCDRVGNRIRGLWGDIRSDIHSGNGRTGRRAEQMALVRRGSQRQRRQSATLGSAPNLFRRTSRQQSDAIPASPMYSRQPSPAIGRRCVDYDVG
ncbi:hypothetical protein BDZ89DRAFT_1061248 [Hymenopellis radicata]|nr:hypothetical protein BDZ89DRAFT_1061248 [Hymenopellis radicata]